MSKKRISYKDEYLDAIKKNNCLKVTKIQKTLEDLYSVIENDKLTNKLLYIKDKDKKVVVEIFG